jgi:hypothetical protein
MAVVEVWMAAGRAVVEGVGYEPAGGALRPAPGPRCPGGPGAGGRAVLIGTCRGGGRSLGSARRSHGGGARCVGSSGGRGRGG